MPSVGMRRTTRVFGVVKGVDGARVLRSGRRLWPDSVETKLRRGHDGDDWYHPIKNSGGHGRDGGGCKPYGWARTKEELGEEEDQEDISVIKEPEGMKLEAFGEQKSVDRMFGIVYSRKRKRLNEQKKNILSSFHDKMCGIAYSRRKGRKMKDVDDENVVGRDVSGCSLRVSPVFSVVVEESYWRSSWFTSVLSSVLVYMRRSRVRLFELAAFLLSQPISGVYSEHGVHFLLDSAANSTGICKFFGTRQFIPMFSVDFSAVPLCFMYMHQSQLLRTKFPLVLVNKSMSVGSEDEIMGGSGGCQLCVPAFMDVSDSDSETVVSEAFNPGNRVILHPSVRGSKLTGRNVQYRNGLNPRSIQKRRSSLRRRRARNPSIGVHKACGALVSDLISSRKDGIPFSSVVSKNKLRSPIHSNSAVNLRDMNATATGLVQDMDSFCCSANILVMETDRCYREEGANVLLEMSSSREWLLVVKKDGSIKYTHKAQKVMRPCSCNRVTHAIIWTGDDNWKLEFPNRQDWFIFKDLYKECFDRNVSASTAKVIPIPGVREVFGYEDRNSTSFSRPNSYIFMNDDELARAMATRNIIYDMDSEDEDWLKKFNNEFFAENEPHEHLSEDNFELMVDAFEKAFYCSPDDYSNEKAAANLCLDLARREVVESVYGYWMRKRKQKKSPLLRVFQNAKKAPLVPKPVLRKRRSLKRQPSQYGRGKQPILLQALAAEQDAVEEHQAMLKVEEAKLIANRSIEAAVLKRQRAQVLMQNADLATYKAMMALTIAEAARVAESTEAAVAHFLD